MIKVLWKKQGEAGGEPILLMERGYNINSMYDARVDINERCHTFEALSGNAQRSLEKMATGLSTKRSAASVPQSLFNDKQSMNRFQPPAGQKNESVCAIDREIPPVIEQDLREAVLQIKDHLYHECNLDLLKCTFYFKYDKANTLYLVYVAGIHAAENNVDQEAEENAPSEI